MPRKYIPRAPMRIIDSVDTRANESTLKQTTQNTTKAQSAEKPTGLSEEQKRDLRSSAWGFYSSLSKNTPDTMCYL